MAEVTHDEGVRQLAADLGSGDPVRVAGAIRDLNLRWQKLDDAAVAAPPAEVLDIVDPEVSEDVAVAYLKALVFHDFVPPVDPHDRLRWTVHALLRHGGSRFATELALRLADPESFGASVTDVLELIQEAGLPDDRARTAAGWLVSFLLGYPRCRQETLAVLAGWTRREDLVAVVEFVRPQLNPDELGLLGSGPPS